MSKHIPGNQKHLILENRIYIKNSLNKGYFFKDIAKYLCQDPTTFSKEVRARHAQTGITKTIFITPGTSASTDIPAADSMSVTR